MDGYQFLASIFESIVSLAWPAAFVVAVALFRGRLTELLPLLRLKHKETEISFRLDRAEAEVAQIEHNSIDPNLQPTPEEKSRYEAVAEHSPRAAILEKRAELEQTIRSVAEPYLATASPKSWKNQSLGASIRVLRSQNIIDEATSALLDDLRVVGNKAAHSSTSERFTKEEAIRFGKLADSTIELIQVLS